MPSNYRIELFVSNYFCSLWVDVYLTLIRLLESVKTDSVNARAQERDTGIVLSRVSDPSPSRALCDQTNIVFCPSSDGQTRSGFGHVQIKSPEIAVYSKNHLGPLADKKMPRLPLLRAAGTKTPSCHEVRGGRGS